jgi:very-short-patch-repair endonuclease
MRFHNLPAKKMQRRELRSRLTPAESYLWSYLQLRQLRGRKFRRQHSVGPYILDFYCPSEKLAVELDGSTHDHEAAQNYDGKRNAFLKALGIRTLRFENEEVRRNMEGVLRAIEEHFGHHPGAPRHPSSMRRGKDIG